MKKKAPPPEAIARITRWAILLFFAYALLSGSFHFGSTKPPAIVHNSNPEKTPPAEGSLTAKDCASLTSPLENFSLLASSLIPSVVPSIHTEDVKAGQGNYAVCGQHAALRYEYRLENGSLVFSNLKNKEPSLVTIGDGTMLRGFQQGLIGMRPGGKRSIAFPPALGFGRLKNTDRIQDVNRYAIKVPDLHQSVLLATVELSDLSPAVPAGTQPLRVIDRQFSNGTRVQCGDTVSVETTLWKVDGTKLFSTIDTNGPLIFTLGSSQVPYGIEQAVLDMPEGAQRTAILPAAFIAPLASYVDNGMHNALEKITLPHETLLAEFQLVHVGDELLNGAYAVMPPPPAPPPPAPIAPDLPRVKKIKIPPAPKESEEDTRESPQDGNKESPRPPAEKTPSAKKKPHSAFEDEEEDDNRDKKP